MTPLSALLPSLPLLDRSRAEDFARAVDAPAPLRGRAAAASAAPVALVGLARRVSLAGEQLAPATTPRPEFRDALRTRLVAVASVQPQYADAGRLRLVPTAPVPTPDRSRGTRAATVAAGVTASLVALGGVAAAGSQSLPGDPFYGVKRTTEAVQLATAGGNLEQGERHLQFATTRLRELRGLTLGRDAFRDPRGSFDAGEAAALGGAAVTDPEVAELVRQTLADMDTQTRRGTDLLTGVFLSSQAKAPLQVLSRFTTRQSTGLELLLPALPRPSQDRAMASLALVVEVADETQELMGTDPCTPVCEKAPPAPPVAPTPSQEPLVVEPPATTEPSAPPLPQEPVLPDGDSEPVAPLEAPTPQPGTPAGTSPSPSPSTPPSPEPAPAPTTSSRAGQPLPILPLFVQAVGMTVADPVQSLRSVLRGLS